MNYSQSLDYLYHKLPMFQRIGPKAFKKDLTNIKALAERLDNPEKALSAIHIAGTNGKGTTAHLIAGILQDHGFSVGLYTSPHYKDFRERIKVNGKLIDRAFVRKFVNWYDRHAHDIKASFFELTVAMAFDYFRKEDVDFVVLETGLGGRLDSTNIITPLLSVITNISLDHTNFLGNTLDAIAAEKGGIIKNGVPVLVGRKQSETEGVFKKIAEEKGSVLTYAQELVEVKSVDENIILKITGKQQAQVKDNEMPFFRENLRTAVAAVIILNNIRSLKVNLDLLQRGANSFQELTHFIGRWMRLGEDPAVIADSAHNKDGLCEVLRKLKEMKPKKFHFVLGFVSDKDIEPLLAYFPAEAKYYFCKADVPRGLEADRLKQHATKYGLQGKAYSSVRKALAAAKLSAGSDDLIYVGGSIFTVAEVV